MSEGGGGGGKRDIPGGSISPGKTWTMPGGCCLGGGGGGTILEKSLVSEAPSD